MMEMRRWKNGQNALVHVVIEDTGLATLWYAGEPPTKAQSIAVFNNAEDARTFMRFLDGYFKVEAMPDAPKVDDKGRALKPRKPPVGDRKPVVATGTPGSPDKPAEARTAPLTVPNWMSQQREVPMPPMTVPAYLLLDIPFDKVVNPYSALRDLVFALDHPRYSLHYLILNGVDVNTVVTDCPDWESKHRQDAPMSCIGKINDVGIYWSTQVQPGTAVVVMKESNNAVLQRMRVKDGGGLRPRAYVEAMTKRIEWNSGHPYAQPIYLGAAQVAAQVRQVVNTGAMTAGLKEEWQKIAAITPPPPAPTPAPDPQPKQRKNSWLNPLKWVTTISDDELLDVFYRMRNGGSISEQERQQAHTAMDAGRIGLRDVEKYEADRKFVDHQQKRAQEMRDRGMGEDVIDYYLRMERSTRGAAEELNGMFNRSPRDHRGTPQRQKRNWDIKPY